MCRYPDYKTLPSSEEPYTNNIQFWHIWFARYDPPPQLQCNLNETPPSRLLFVVLFENIVAVTVMFLKLVIPDISSALKYKIRREVSPEFMGSFKLGLCSGIHYQGDHH